MLASLLFVSGLVQATPSAPTEGDRKLVFADEFDKGETPDPSAWTYETGNLRNEEQQYYTGGRKNNGWVADGHLVLQARRECWDHWDYTSSSLVLNRPLKNARVEIRAQFPSGRGLASTLWLLGSDYPKKPFPDCGGVSIEHAGRTPDELGFVLNTTAFNYYKDNALTEGVTFPNLTDGFHTYVIDFAPVVVTVSVDGELQLEFKKDAKNPEAWPFDNPMTLRMSLAVGGALGGNEGEGKDYHKGVDITVFPGQMKVDYVRVYE
jgi:beta-glucanase (GH16 family)